MRINVRGHVNAKYIMFATEQGTARALKRAGGYTRQVARRSIRKSKKASVPGTPPHTRRGQLKNAILFHADRRKVIVGPSSELISEVGATNEWGLTLILKAKRKKYRIGLSGPIDVRKKTPIFAPLKTQAQVDRATRIDKAVWVEEKTVVKHYPKRQFMEPALREVAPRLNQFWKDAIR